MALPLLQSYSTMVFVLGPRLDHRLGHLAGQVEAWRIDMFKLSDGFDQNVDPQVFKNKCTILH